MKREAFGHTKMKRLCRRLNIPAWQAVGLLESIWHLTAREAPRGDIGRLSDEDIALAIDYRGDEAAMIEGLVSSGWLDRPPEARLAVHDWAEHADDAVQMRLARRREYFVGGRAPKVTKLSIKERESAQKFYGSAPAVRTDGAQNGALSALPEPEPEPEPEPVMKTPPPTPSCERDGAGAPLVLVSPDLSAKPATKRKPHAGVLQEVARGIHGRHPSAYGRRDLGVGGVEKKLAAILTHKRIPSAEAETYLRRIDRIHAAICASEAWRKDGGQFAKSLRNYLAPTEERYDVDVAAPVRQEPRRLMA